MSTAEKISISLPHEIAELLRQSVSSGEYSTASEVVREALREWRANKDRKALEIETLRRLWQDGIDSGEGTLGDIDRIKQVARTRQRAI